MTTVYVLTGINEGGEGCVSTRVFATRLAAQLAMRQIYLREQDNPNCSEFYYDDDDEFCSWFNPCNSYENTSYSISQATVE